MYPMDLFDFLPITPGMPGDNARDRSPGHQLATGVGSVVLPTINFVVVLFAGFAQDGTIALVAMPIASGTLLFLLARSVSVGLGWAIVLAIYCAVFCFMANLGALLLAALGQFYSTF
jgi:hypothetical protein